MLLTFTFADPETFLYQHAFIILDVVKIYSFSQGLNNIDLNFDGLDDAVFVSHIIGADYYDYHVVFDRDSLKAVGAPTSAKELGISDENVIDALTMAHTIRPERYTILGDNGISEDAAYELALKTGVIK